MSDHQIIIIDDHPIIVDSLTSLLENRFHIQKAYDGESAVHSMRETCADIAIVDYSLPDIDCKQLIANLRDINPDLHTVIYTVHDEPWIVKEMLDIGSEAVVLKNDDLEELLIAVESICAGLTYYSQRFTNMVEQMSNSYSKREIEIIKCIGAGMKSSDIARQIHVSENTVEYHRKKLMRLLNARNNANLVAIAISKGIIKG